MFTQNARRPAFPRRALSPLVALLVLTPTLLVPTLVAQQYCLSGVVTSLSCPGNGGNCGFKVGDPVATTFTVLPSSAGCVSSPIGSQCGANTTFSASIGAMYWANQNPLSMVGFSDLSTGSLAIITGQGFLSPNPTPSMAAPGIVITFEMNPLPPNSFPTNTLPTALPLPAAAASANATVEFSALIPSPTASASFSYTGQNCALQPGSSVPPTITPSGIVPVYSTAKSIQPGSWVSIFGTNLASAATTWTGNFPTSLGGTSVMIDGKPAYLWYVSPTQINLQAPDDTAAGSVNVVVTTGGGSATSTVTLGQVGPSFSLLDSKHVAGIILRASGTGAYGGGSYDIVGPTGSSLGYATVAAKAGDVLELFGVGFGPTNPAVPAGQVYSGAAPTTSQVSVNINNVPVKPSFAGITSAGLYQINITLPSGLGSGDVPLVATVGGVQTPSGVVVSVQ
jgi:uncharacterized protein (TIGR03437 family)